MAKYFDCVGLGICALDHLALLPHFPAADEKLDMLSFSVQGGGPVPTALATMARMGIRVSFVGKVGADDSGRAVLSELEELGVDISAAVIDPYSRTARAFIWVDQSTAKRTVVLDRTDTANLNPEEIRRDIVEDAAFFLTDARETEAALRATELAKAKGSKIVLDLGDVRTNTEAFLELADYPVVSDTFLMRYFPGVEPVRGVKRLLEWGVEAAVVTCGTEGSYLAVDGTVYHQPVYRVRAVDRTGAGDVYHGAFVFWLVKKESLDKAVQFASAAAALKCRRLGGRRGIPDEQEVLELMDQQPEVRPRKVA